MLSKTEVRSSEAADLPGYHLFRAALIIFLLCLIAVPAAASQAPQAEPKPFTPLDSVGQPVVWCYHGQAPDNRLVVVDKSRQRLLVLRYLGKLALEFEYPCASGEKAGPKSASRDEKTPEGVYFITKRYKDNKVTIFGDRALHLNYPNPQDRAQGRKGDGIYIHGSNREYKPRSSNGCLVMDNHDLALVEPLLTEQFTPVIVVGRMALPSLDMQTAACDYLRTVDVPQLSQSASRLPNDLELVRNGSARKKALALISEFDHLDKSVKVRRKGLALFGDGRQWVLLVNQVITGPEGKEIAATRRFYLAGPKPGELKLVQSQWVLPDMASARLVASWAEPKPVAVAKAAPVAQPEPATTKPTVEDKPKPPAAATAEPKAPSQPAATTEPVEEAKPAAQAAPKPETKPATEPVAVTKAEPTPKAKAQPKDEPKSAQQARQAQDPEIQIKGMLAAWAQAWQHKQLNKYMSFYAKDFRGSGKNRAEWRKHKRYLNRTYKKITVRISELMIKVKGDHAQVSFVQRYRSDWHQDTGLKSMDLVLVKGRWLIRTETWHKMPPAAVRRSAS